MDLRLGATSWQVSFPLVPSDQRHLFYPSDLVIIILWILVNADLQCMAMGETINTTLMNLLYVVKFPEQRL